MTSRYRGDSQERAASRSGFSDRSGRRIEKGEGGSKHRKPRQHRTRTDPTHICMATGACADAGSTS